MNSAITNLNWCTISSINSMYLYMHRYCTVMMLPELWVSPHWMSSSLQASLRANPNPWLWTMKWTCLENLVYHFFRQLWLVLGVKLTEINSNWFSRCINLTSKPYPAKICHSWHSQLNFTEEFDLSSVLRLAARSCSEKNVRFRWCEAKEQRIMTYPYIFSDSQNS